MREANSARRKEQCADPARRAANAARLKEAAKAIYPSVIGDGIVYATAGEADRALGLSQGACLGRVKSTSERFRWWFKVPNHNDPACDAVEECWALMQFAKACPDHENAPAWAKAHAQRHCDVPDGFWA